MALSGSPGVGGGLDWITGGVAVLYCGVLEWWMMWWRCGVVDDGVESGDGCQGWVGVEEVGSAVSYREKVWKTGVLQGSVLVSLVFMEWVILCVGGVEGIKRCITDKMRSGSNG